MMQDTWDMGDTSYELTQLTQGPVEYYSTLLPRRVLGTVLGTIVRNGCEGQVRCTILEYCSTL
jgi:hypothetical protein